MVNEIKLGLGNPPYPIYLYVDKLEVEGRVYGWYNYDFNKDKQIPVPYKALTGYICELKLTGKEFKGKDNLKLDVVVCADELYVIRSGIETNFSKSFLLAASLVEDFSKPLQIVANPGDENVVFCSLYDATTKAKIRYQWNPTADWGSIIENIQLKMGSVKYDLDFDEDAVDPSSKPVTKPQPSTQPKAPASAAHPHDVRVKQVRILTDYPVDLIRKWLQSQGVNYPSQLSAQRVDELIKTICLGWAANHHFDLDPNYIELSYREQVIDTIASGVPEIQAIQQWMNYVAGLRTPAGVR
ncbi:hypothetical protein [Nostoc sp. FACHB-190]|uniref:hypothetical protein n=1 Tax=Nostoc sp. FACHB-190 TaxID=2692838 RepID=UPI00168A3340|nr:hypothetical protein [Nostoc sp. FACHB-190]MBD2303878.1 hypothetical protein [Nostoc sp. FACHB-190]